MTSAASVLPVPLGPENIAVRPSPRPPPRRRCHPSSTKARWRTRAVTSRSDADTAGVTTRSDHPALGSIRRARRWRPAAFCSRAPAWMSATSSRPPRWRAARRAAVAARSIRCGPSRNAEVASGRVAELAVEGPPPTRFAFVLVERRGDERERHVVRPFGSPPTASDDDHRERRLRQPVEEPRP